MKNTGKILSVFLIICLLTANSAFSSSWTASAEEYYESTDSEVYSEVYRSGSLLFAIIDGAAVVTECDSGASGTVVIPETVSGYPVTSIGPQAFLDCAGITSVELPGTPIGIGDYAFKGCAALESIVAVNGVGPVGEGAFFGCGDVEMISGAADDGETEVFSDDEEISKAVSRFASASVAGNHEVLTGTSQNLPDSAIDNIIGQLLTFPSTIDIRSLSIPAGEQNDFVARVVRRFENTLPLEYAAAAVSSFSCGNQSGILVSLNPNYGSVNKTKYQQRLSVLHDIVDPIMAECEYKDPYQTMVYVHDFLALNSVYDNSLKKYTAYELLTGHTGVCQAYSEAFNIFMHLKGIESVMLTTSSHGWNAVKLGGKWYHIDVTWDDPVVKNVSSVVSNHENYEYFLLTNTELLNKDENNQHKNWSQSDISCTDKTYYKLHRGNIKDMVYVPDYDNPASNDRWYYHDSASSKKRIIATDRYGNHIADESIPDSGHISLATVHDGIFYYSTGRDIKAYCPASGQTKTLHELTEGNKEPLSTNCPVLSISVNSSGILSYKYRDWNTSGGTTSSYTADGKTKIDTKDPGRLMGMSIDPAAMSVEVGDQVTLDPPLLPSNSTASVTWTSSDPSKASVDQNGVVTGVAEAASVTITASSGSYQATCRVKVVPKAIHASGITVNNAISVNKGSTGTITAVLQPSNSTDTVVWTSSDPSVASVDQNGTVTAVQPGTAVINARAGSYSASCTVTVVIPATGISLDKDSLTLAKGSLYTLKATLQPSDCTETVTWTTSNSGIATVTNGKVRGVGPGQAIITAKAGGHSAQCTVTVSNNSNVVSVGSSSYSSFSAAMSANTGNKLYELLSDADCTLSPDNKSNAKKTITVRLNGYTLNVINEKSGCSITTKDNGDGTVTYTALSVTLPKFRWATLSLEGELAINFAVQLSDEILADPGNYALRCVRGGNTTMIPISQARKLTSSEYDNLYNFYYSGIYATQMGDNVRAVIVDTRNNKEQGSAITYSVKQYAQNMLNRSTTSDSVKSLLKAMLNYGAASQEYFGVNTDNLVNNILSDADREVVNNVSVPDSCFKFGKGGEVDGIVPDSVTLSLGSQTYIDIIFRVTKGANINDYVFACAGQALTKPALYSSDSSYDYYQVTIPDIASYELDDAFHVTAAKKGSSDQTYLDYSALTYACRMQNKQSVGKLARSIYLYNKAANEYFNL